MMTEVDIMPVVLEACPEFRQAWEEHLSGTLGHVGVYIDLGEFASFVVESFENKNIALVGRAFDAVEKLLTEGDHETDECVTLGFIESLQNRASGKPYGMDAFLPFLGPRSQQSWNDLVAFWNGSAPSTDTHSSGREPGGQ